MEKIKLQIVFVVLIALAACSKSNTPHPTPLPPAPPVYDPTAATLVAPADGQPCLSGATVSATQSSVTFSWDKADYTDTYELHIINLTKGDTLVKSTANLTLVVTLSNATPYKWYIISRENNVSNTIQSDLWKFYNSGPGTTVYPPYPADIISPTFSQRVPLAATLTLQWKGNAGGIAIKSYDVYLSNDPSPALYQSNVTGNTLNVSGLAGGIYYWKIVTRDNAGNTSTTQVYNFYLE